MGMSTRAHIQSLSSIEPILVNIFEVVERWVPVEVWVHDRIANNSALLVMQPRRTSILCMGNGPLKTPDIYRTAALIVRLCHVMQTSNN